MGMWSLGNVFQCKREREREEERTRERGHGRENEREREIGKTGKFTVGRTGRWCTVNNLKFVGAVHLPESRWGGGEHANSVCPSLSMNTRILE